MKKLSKLQFTEEERAHPILEKAISKSEKAITKLEKAQAKIPKKKIMRKERTFDTKTGKSKVRLYFEEVDKPKPPSKLAHEVKNTPAKLLVSTIHKEISKDEQDNIGLETVHGAERASEFSANKINRVYRHQKAKPHQRLTHAEKKSIHADVDYLYQKSIQEHPETTTNPLSKWQQKQAIKKQYMLARNGASISTKQTISTTIAVKKSLKKGVNGISNSVAMLVKNPKVVLLIIAVLLVSAVICTMLSSTALIFQGVIQSVVSTSYTSEDTDIIATDAAYTSLENNLQNQINDIESDYPSYDEYRYNLDGIYHDSHQLASYLTALLQTYTVSEANTALEEIFHAQYMLTITSTVEIRYREEERVDSYTTVEADGTVTDHEDVYTVDVPYEYYILEVTLENNGIDNVVANFLNTQQLEMYQIYLETEGNKSLVFGGGTTNDTPSTDLNGVVFVDGERLGNDNTVTIALSQVGNVGGEPYWSWYGFDSRVAWCACFVSWVLDKSGYDEPTFAACQAQGVPYFTSNGRWATSDYSNIAAGDVIFFDWENDGHSDHVGIVIGTDGSRVYTVEGNSSDTCRVRDYDLNSSSIMGYGLMN